jgi:TCP-1/cpn60 chaperonin family
VRRAGMHKIVINHLDKTFVTSDASVMLEVQHPAAKLVIMAARSQESEIGDGTNLVRIHVGPYAASKPAVRPLCRRPQARLAGPGRRSCALARQESAVCVFGDRTRVRKPRALSYSRQPCAAAAPAGLSAYIQVITLAGELLEKAGGLLKEGLTTTEVADGYVKASAKARPAPLCLCWPHPG